MTGLLRCLPPRSTVVDRWRVLEIGERTAVGMCGTLLADLGADVVLIEPEHRLSGRKWCNEAAVTANKRHKTWPELAQDQTLLTQADVVVLASDIDARQHDLWVRDLLPGQVICDITGFGHEGPLAGRACSEPLLDAYAGATDTTGYPNQPPTTLGVPLLEMETAVYAAAAILAALRVRRHTGLGQRIDMAVFDVGINALATFIPPALVGAPATRSGNHHPILSPWNCYATRDGSIVVCAPTDAQWGRLCTAIGRDDLRDDPRFASATTRLANEDAIDRIVARWAALLTTDECLSRLAAEVIPSGPVTSLEDLPTEPNVAHRGLIQESSAGAGAAEGRFIPSPIRIDRADSVTRSTERPTADAVDVTSDRRAAGGRLEGVRPLNGLRVIEIGMNTVAPLAGRQLAALGADVVKVEPPTGDTNRVNPPLRADGESYIFAISNTGKRGLVLDLKNPSDRDRLLDLIGTADVVIENLKPGSLMRLGLGAGEIRRSRPQLIYCSVNGFGHDSVYPGRPALDTVIQGMSGVMACTVVDGSPLKAGISIADQLGGQFGLLAVLAALERRDRTGRGATIDLAMQDCAAWATQVRWGTQAATQRNVAICAALDGYVAIEGEEHDILAALEHAGGTQAATAMGVLMREEVVEKVRAHPACDAAPVLGVRELLDHPQTVARRVVLERRTPAGDSWVVLGSPLRLLSTPASVDWAMAPLGFDYPEPYDLRGFHHEPVQAYSSASTRAS